MQVKKVQGNQVFRHRQGLQGQGEEISGAFIEHSTIIYEIKAKNPLIVNITIIIINIALVLKVGKILCFQYTQ